MGSGLGLARSLREREYDIMAGAFDPYSAYVRRRVGDLS